MNLLRFDTNAYVRSHMREPAGTGLWAFRFDAANDDWIVPTTMSYVEARAAARAEAQRRGAQVALVLP